MIADDGAPEAILDRAAHGYRTTLLSQAIRVMCKATGIVVIARLVSPSAHGLFAMAASLMFFLIIFRDLGLGVAAVQTSELDEEQRSTLWQAHRWLGLLLSAAMIALAPAVAAFYHEPAVAPLLATMSVGMALISFNAWPRVLLARDLRFAELNRLESWSAVIGTVAMIGAAFLGGGAYTFVAFLLVSEFVCLVGSWRACRWRPLVPARWSSLRRLWRSGADLTGHNVLLCLLQQIDTLLMGRWFGPTALGLYNRPNQLMLLPSNHVATPLTQVLMASLSRLGSTSPDFVRHVRNTANLIAHLTMPLAVTCMIMPNEIVRLILGPAWPEAGPLLRWLAFSGAASYLTTTVYALCLATGQTRRLMAISAFAFGGTWLALWLGRSGGPIGLAIGLACANVVLLVPRLWWATLGTPVRLRDFGAAFMGPLALAVAVSVGMLAVHIPCTHFSWGLRLMASLAGGTVAGIGLVLAWPRLRTELLQVWLHRPGVRSPATAGATSVRA